MPRLLAIAERRVPASERDAYVATLALRRRDASAQGVQFWAFEHADDPGRFVEFTESPDAAAIRGFAGDAAAADLWREVRPAAQQEREGD